MCVKQCTSCLRSLPNSEFALYKAANGRFYSRSKCTGCLKSAKQNWAKSNAAHAREYFQGYKAKNRARMSAMSHMAYGIKKYGRCSCCSNDDVFQFVLNRPANMVIDHIVPDTEGGKHCLFNLQYMTVSDHCTKSAKENRYPKQS